MSNAAHPRYGQVDYEYAARLSEAESESDGPVWMVNLMKYRETADYLDGRDDISGREADDLYTPIEPLQAVGADIVLAADVDAQLLGDAPVWDRVAVVKYPTRRAFIDMQARPDFQALHVHKDAGMEETIVIGCLPMDRPEAAAGLDQPKWDEVPHPPTADDGPVTVVHVIRFDDVAGAAATPEQMEAYQSEAATVAGPHGVRISGWFSVEGTVAGDGRAWHQVRFNAFPSKAAFMAVAADPARLEAQRNHREVAIADTYTLILRPFIDTLADSVAS